MTITGQRFDGIPISLEDESGTQLGVELLERRYTTETIRNTDLEVDFMRHPLGTAEECDRIAKPRDSVLASGALEAPQDCVESLANANPVADPNLEAAAIVASRISQPLKGARLRVIYLAERAGSTIDALIDPSRLPWSVYAYSPNGFAREPTIQEHEELVWLARNLKLEVNEYSRQLYNGEDVGDDDNDGGGGDGGDGSGVSESTSSHQPRKRGFR
ncbi:hypothetical protein SO802_021388 [Lithocarpus litseifolius]|uniref:Uncharacterized protein n=1 Tax=Lithocarpus litseifolius TaxID=425828 RepID=A0AAW2CF29_9ROSI